MAGGGRGILGRGDLIAIIVVIVVIAAVIIITTYLHHPSIPPIPLRLLTLTLTLHPLLIVLRPLLALRGTSVGRQSDGIRENGFRNQQQPEGVEGVCTETRNTEVGGR